MSDVETKSRRAVFAYGVGLLLCVAATYPFVLCTYGAGGAPTYSGEHGLMEELTGDQPPFALHRQGIRTPISGGLFHRIQCSQWAAVAAGLVALPLLVLGLFTYLDQVRGNPSAPLLRLALALSLPHRIDGRFTMFAKCYLWWSIAAAWTFSSTALSVGNESVVCHRFCLSYLIGALLALLAAAAWPARRHRQN